MKKLLYIIASIAIVACGGNKEQSISDLIETKDVKEIKAKRNSIINDLKELETALVALDTVKKTVLVSTLTATSQDFYHYVEIQGNVETKQNLVLFPEMGGTLKSVLVKEGQKVLKGQVLAIIDDSGLKDQLAQLESSAALSKTTFERQERLWAQKIGSEIQFLQAKTSFEASAKAVDHLKAQLDKTNIKAPFNGVIDDIITNEGSLVMPGQSPVIRIVNLNNMTISAEVPETYIKHVKKGKRVEMFIPVLNETAETTITQAGNFINPSNRKFKVEMNIPRNINAKPNMSVQLNINDYHNDAAILIPQSIVSENENNEEYIFTAEKKGTGYIAKKTFITLGRTNKNDIEVLKGLNPNTQVILEGARSVKEGQEITILN